MWPDEARCAAAFTFDFDAESVWIADDPENAKRPGVLSQGTYGAKVAVPLILDLLERHDVRATFFVVGQVAEQYPDRVGGPRARRPRVYAHLAGETFPRGGGARAHPGAVDSRRVRRWRDGIPLSVLGFQPPHG